MNYWIIALPREDMEHCMTIGVFGSTRKTIINRVKKGDHVACYVTREYKIIGLGSCTSDYYLDDRKIFKKDGHFIDRFDFEAQPLPCEIDFMQIVDKMSFIKNLAYWSVYFRNGIVQISADDWKLIEGQGALSAV